jgi:hypothetical protein
MALPEKNDIAPELLYLFVLGPGTSETVLLRIPPDRWIIIDSFKCGKPNRPAAESIVSRYGGKVEILVLTHPHQDHYPGFIDLVDRYDDAILGCVHPRDCAVPGALPIDAMTALKEGAKPAFTRIWDEWTRNAARRWDTFRHVSRAVGDASITSLHPVRPLHREQWSRDPNAISTAMLVEWHNLRLLLGADVPNTEWPDIGHAFPRLSDHAAMKVPHHGSREAIHESFGNASPERFWVITPFRKQRLPRAEDMTATGEPEGLCRALSFVREIRLTSLPFRHVSEAEDPCVTTRGELRDQSRPVRTHLLEDNLMTTAAALDRQVVVGFDPKGTIAEEWYGRGSIRVSR